MCYTLAAAYDKCLRQPVFSDIGSQYFSESDIATQVDWLLQSTMVEFTRAKLQYMVKYN